MEEECVRKRYLLTLYRQGVYFNAKQVQDLNVISEDDEKQFFSTDYFDKLVVKKIEPDKEFATFMGINRENGYNSDIIAVHNYSIFQDITLSEEKKENDIFADLPYPYLGLVHVYITPDVLARLKLDNTNYIESFENDLKKTIAECCGLLDIRGSVFRMLSSSDFMIVVRSKCPEEVISVVTTIRSRKVCEKGKEDNCLSAYKTYTILTLNGSGITIEGSTSKAGKVAIRGRYSNHYWIDKNNGDLRTPKSFVHLNGRYDFLIYLEHNEFITFYPLLCKVKGIQTDKEFIIPDDRGNSGYSEELLYLYDLIHLKYLSYLNERYFIDDESEKIFLERLKINSVILEDVYLSSEYEKQKYLFDFNYEACNKIIEEIKQIKNEYVKILAYNQSIYISLDLLCNLAYLCQNVNNLSDARIYVVSLLRQMKVVVTSFKDWMKLSDELNDVEMRNFMDNYLRKSVVSLEAYASIIRNNNLQTLQAPSYNAVSGISMEKILIGYSRFLKTVMDFWCSRIKENKKFYFPVMLPELEQSSLSIEVMFPEWQISNKEKSKKEKTYLMITSGPATSELVNMAYIVTTLFHEMAHHLRYEERNERNKVILRLMVEDLSDALTKYLFTIIVDSRTGVGNTIDLQATFSEILTEELTNTLKKAFTEEHLQQSLENFKDIIQKNLDYLLKLLKRNDNDILLMIQAFIDDTNEIITNDEETINILVSLSKTLNILIGKENLKENNNVHGKLELTKEIRDKMKKDIPIEFEAKIKSRLEKDISKYVSICKLKGLDDDSSKNIENMGNSIIAYIRQYFPFSNLVDSDIVLKDEKIAERIYDHLYDEFYKKWQDRLIHTTDSFMQDKEWIKQGRRLGIDYNIASNRERFQEYFSKAVKVSDGYNFESAMKRISLYREETSDLFMCVMCDLNLIMYLTVCAEMYPIALENYELGYIERLTDVILVQWYINDVCEIRNDNRTKLCEHRPFIELWECLNGSSANNLDRDMLIHNFQGFIYAHRETKNLKYYIAVLAKQILEIIDDRINWFQKREYLLEDYLKGKIFYKTERNKFIQENKRIFDFCEVIKEFLCAMGSPDSKLQEKYHRACIDFIVGYYYDDMIENAKRGMSDAD